MREAQVLSVLGKPLRYFGILFRFPVLTNTVRIWDPAAGQCTYTLEGHSDWVKSFAWSPDGSRLASQSDDKTVRIWDPATGQCTSTLEGHSDWVKSIAWSPDGSRLASASYDKTVRVWDPAAGQCTPTLELEGHISLVSTIAWSPDGSRLASQSDDNTVRIWDPATGKCTSTLELEGHRDWVKSIAWLPDGSRLVSVSYDKTVKSWNPATGQCVFTLCTPSFDESTLNHLHAVLDILTVNLGSTQPVEPSRLTQPGIHGFVLSGGLSWITFHGTNLLWLPPEYRPSNPSLFCIYGAMVAIGCSSGRVIFLALSDHNLLSGI